MGFGCGRLDPPILKPTCPPECLGGRNQKAQVNEEGKDQWVDVSGEQLEEAIDELEREYNLRERLFPGWIKTGSLSRADARDRQKRLAWAVAALKRVQDGQARDDYERACDDVGSRAAGTEGS